jgi:hypothetical protein
VARSLLLAGKIDAQWAFTATAGLELPAMGENVRVLSPGDYDQRTDGYVIFVRDEAWKTRWTSCSARSRNGKRHARRLGLS